MIGADDGRTHSVRVGGAVDIALEEVVLTEAGEPVRVSGMPFPASTLTVVRATTSRIDAFGLEFAKGKNGFAAPFSWAA